MNFGPTACQLVLETTTKPHGRQNIHAVNQQAAVSSQQQALWSNILIYA